MLQLSRHAAAAAAAAAAACLALLPEAALAFGGVGSAGGVTSSSARGARSTTTTTFGSSSSRSISSRVGQNGAGVAVGVGVTPLFATWSNGQAIKEYQDFLATGQSDLVWADDGPSVIVAPTDHVDGTSPSPVVEALVALGEGDDLVLAPGDPLPEKMGDREEYPIYIALPPYELDGFLTNLINYDGWSGRTEDFVFLSGGEYCGCVEPVLKPRGYCRDAMTQVLLGGMTLPKSPYKPQDLSVNLGLDSQGDKKIAGECAACGKWGGAFAQRLGRNGISAKVGFYREWRRWMWERAMYDAVFNLVGGVREEETTLADAALYYGEEVSEMLWQCTSQLRGMLAVTVTYGFEERLFGFAESKAGEDVKCTLGDPIMYPYVFPKTLAECKDISQYLNYAQATLGALPGVTLPRASSTEKPSAMRKGNLRADGVL